MTPTTARFGVALAMLLGAGCALTQRTRIHATVAAAASPCEPADAGALPPVEGALVSMDCPQLYKPSRSPLGRTDRAGRFHLEEPALGRWIHDGCDLVVEHPGYRPQHVHVADVCDETIGDHCVRATVVAALARSAPVDGCDGGVDVTGGTRD